jgi:5-methylcytosine-specific restriction enzyme A
MAAPSGIVDSHRLARLLSARFGIALTGVLVRTNGGMRSGVRATDIPEPNGFGVSVDPGWRSVEAAFVPDNFAGQLIRTMGVMPQSARSGFERTAAAFADIGAKMTLRINDSAVATLGQLPPAPWNRFELKVMRLSEAPVLGEDALFRDSVEVAGACLALVLALLPVDEVGAEPLPLFEGGLPEGAKTRVEVNRYERSPVNRAACIARYGARCNACGFDFGRTYGPLGDGYIEVHHIVPVSKMSEGYVVDPVRDLIPLCANCHGVVHRQDPPLEIDELMALLSHRRGT